MFKRKCYTVSEMVEKLAKHFGREIEPEDLIHLGIKGKLPIYIRPVSLAKTNPNRKFLRVIKLPKLYGANYSPLPGSEDRQAKEYERLSHRSLEIVDKEGIYQLGKTVEVTGLWPDEGNSPYKPYISISGLDQVIEGLPDQQIITGLPVCLSDLYILGRDAQSLGEECKASQRGKVVKKTELTHADAERILHMEAVCFNEGTGPDINNMLFGIKDKHPDLAKKYSWLFLNIEEPTN